MKTKKKLHNIFQPSAQQLVDEVCYRIKSHQDDNFNWKAFYKFFDKELEADMKKGVWIDMGQGRRAQ